MLNLETWELFHAQGILDPVFNVDGNPGSWTLDGPWKFFIVYLLVVDIEKYAQCLGFWGT